MDPSMFFSTIQVLASTGVDLTRLMAPAQSLFLMNAQFVHDQANSLARRLLDDKTLPDDYEEEAFLREVDWLESRGVMPTGKIVRRLSSRGFAASRIQAYLEHRQTDE